MWMWMWMWSGLDGDTECDILLYQGIGISILSYRPLIQCMDVLYDVLYWFFVI